VKRSTFQWPAEARATVCTLWIEGRLSAVEIAAAVATAHGFEATKSAVVGIAFRAGLAFKGRPANRPSDPAGRMARRPAQRREQRARQPKPAPAPKAIPAPKPAPVLPAAALPSLGIPFAGVRDGQCRYIADDPKAWPVTCCGHPTASGSPWCEGHRAVCTVPIGARASVWIPSFRFRRAA
jgi:hypothetical protein